MQNEYYTEPLEVSEFDFLAKKAEQEKRLYKKILIALQVGCIIFSFGGAWKYIVKGNLSVFSWENYFITLLILSSISAAAIWFSIYNNLRKISLDLRYKTKIIERALIKRKTFLPQNNTFHFYLNSFEKLSIEVDEEHFNELTEGDEVNIEYSSNAHIYFGYF
jgi:hypothetical protein